MALAIGPGFQNYLSPVLQVLHEASAVQPAKDDYDQIDYINELRDGCLEAYTGIIQGVKAENNQFPGKMLKCERATHPP
jgi:importin subunit beta-1